jgi:DNA (cytosine-5)-methyltransferase 1
VRVLDLFCCAGGAATGYARAGYDVVGVDIDPQPHYPFPFIQLDALQVMRVLNRGLSVHGFYLDDFDLIHASPPCQLFTMYNNVKSIKESTSEKYLNLIPQTGNLLLSSGKPYVIENVMGARKILRNPIRLCGTSFGIPVRRHRLFELGGWTNVSASPSCDHGRFTERRFPGSSNRPNGRTVCNIGEYRVPLTVQKECMTVDWKVTLRELSEMVPPPITQWIGEQFNEYMGRR